MAKPRINARDPFAVDLSPEQKKELGIWLADELSAAYDARITVIGPNGDIDYGHFLYEQGRTPPDQRRWKGAADLTSYLVTEKVDALRSRVMKTIFAEPFSIVEGWGEDAQKAPYVEEFHEWKRREEQLRRFLSGAIHNGLIEQNGILEVVDRADIRLVRKLEQFAAKLAEDGNVLLDDKQQPVVDTDEQGKPKPATEDVPTVKAATARYEHVRTGPSYRIHSLRDFLYLPGHAADKSELYGMFARTWLSVARLKELAESGIYDEEAVKAIAESSDRDRLPTSLERQGITLAEQRGETAEKELWRGLLLKDLDEDGLAEWYICTVHLPSRTILRVQHDDLGVPRFIDLTPFPRPDSVYGYSFVLDKLVTTAEEHTALRNMIADRSTLATNPPMKRLQGALWEPDEQPWGTGATIDVRSMDEVQAMEVPDVPVSAMQREAAILQAAERLTGVNDTAVGVQTQEQRTLGELQMVQQAGAVRTEEVVENIQASLEQLDMVRHEIWIRTLETQPDGPMAAAPDSVVRSLRTKGLDVPNGKFTANLLRGNLRFKPHGSVETADKNRMRADYNGLLTVLTGLAKINPIAAQMLQSPDVLQAILEQALRLYNVPDKQPFIVALKQVVEAMQAQAQQQQMMAQMGGMVPGQPPGLPPGPPQAGGQPPAQDPRQMIAAIAARNPQLAAALGHGGPQ